MIRDRERLIVETRDRGWVTMDWSYLEVFVEYSLLERWLSQLSVALYECQNEDGDNCGLKAQCFKRTPRGGLHK
jgi:hypothetical protein